MKTKKQIKELLYDLGCVWVYGTLGILASPPYPSTLAVWLLVIFGLWHLFSAKLFRSSTAETQGRFVSLCDDFRHSSADWREQCEHRDREIRNLRASMLVNNIVPRGVVIGEEDL